jgi:pimeloyl-ACP methyl ester carboxylesterase
MKLFKSAEMAMAQGIKAVVDAFDLDDRFAPFTPERAQYDPMYRKTALEAMPPEDFAQVMRDTIYALFDGPYLTLGMSEKRLKGIRTPTLMMPGNNDIHPRSVAEQVHRLIPNAHWAEVRPHTEEPEQYVYRVLQFLSEGRGECSRVGLTLTAACLSGYGIALSGFAQKALFFRNLLCK